MINALKLELKEIKNSFYLFSLLTWLPLLNFFLIIMIFHGGTAQNLAISIVDYDQSALSRKIIQDINATSTLRVKYIHLNVKEAARDISANNIYATLVIPNHFEKDVLLDKNPKLTAFINAQYLLIAKMVKSTLSGTLRESSVKIDFLNALKNKSAVSESKSAANPINIQVTAFYNTYKNYFLFLVSAIIPSIWQIFIAIAIVASISHTFKQKKEKEFFKDGVIKGLIGKTLPYTVIYLAWGIVFLLYMYGYESWVFKGSIILTIFAMFLTILAYQAISLSFFCISFHPLRALSMTALYTAPALAFVGITFPTESMSGFATFWHNILPISHYLKIQILESSREIDFLLVWPMFKSLLYFLPMWLFVIYKLRKIK